MRPRSIDRGNVEEYINARPHDLASMRPRSIDRGNAEILVGSLHSSYRFNEAPINRPGKFHTLRSRQPIKVVLQ